MSETLKDMVHALINGDRVEAEELVKQALETKTRQIAGIAQPETDLDLDLDLNQE